MPHDVGVNKFKERVCEHKSKKLLNAFFCALCLSGADHSIQGSRLVLTQSISHAGCLSAETLSPGLNHLISHDSFLWQAV